MDIQKIIENLTEIINKATEINMNIINLAIDIDIKSIKNYIHDFYTKFKLKRKAKKLASNAKINISDYTDELTDDETEIITNYIDRIYKNQKVNKYAEVLTNTKLNISKYVTILQNHHRILREVTSSNLTTNELTTVIKKSQESLQKIHNLKIEKHNALLRFRKENQLEREANYPKSKVLFWGLLFIILILESMANSYFYAQGSDLGLLGGVLQAF